MMRLLTDVKSHIKEEAKSSAKHILGNLYNNIYNAPQPSTQPPQSQADEPTKKEKENMPMLEIPVRLFRWVEHIKTGTNVNVNFKQGLLP